MFNRSLEWVKITGAPVCCGQFQVFITAKIAEINDPENIATKVPMADLKHYTPHFAKQLRLDDPSTVKFTDEFNTFLKANNVN